MAEALPSPDANFLSINLTAEIRNLNHSIAGITRQIKAMNVCQKERTPQNGLTISDSLTISEIYRMYSIFDTILCILNAASWWIVEHSRLHPLIVNKLTETFQYVNVVIKTMEAVILFRIAPDQKIDLDNGVERTLTSAIRPLKGVFLTLYDELKGFAHANNPRFSVKETLQRLKLSGGPQYLLEILKCEKTKFSALDEIPAKFEESRVNKNSPLTASRTFVAPTPPTQGEYVAACVNKHILSENQFIISTYEMGRMTLRRFRNKGDTYQPIIDGKTVIETGSSTTIYNKGQLVYHKVKVDSEPTTFNAINAGSLNPNHYYGQ